MEIGEKVLLGNRVLLAKQGRSHGPGQHQEARRSIAFYTIGDSNRICPVHPRNPNPPNTSQAYEQLAHRAASRVYGVPSISDATTALGSIPEGSISHIYFFGHGMASGDFVFSGRRAVGVPEPPFYTNGQYTTTENSGARNRFFLALARIADRQRTVITLYACWSNNGPFLSELVQVMRTAGVLHGEIGGTRALTRTHAECFANGRDIRMILSTTPLEVGQSW